jgi:uncharacterized membrane protein YozB (DUF420 family)
MFLSRALFQAVLTVVAALCGVIAGLLLLLAFVGTIRGDENLHLGTILTTAAGFSVGGLACWRLRRVFETPPDA